MSTLQDQNFFPMALDLLCVTNAEGRFLHVNPAMSRILAWTCEALEDRTFLDLVASDEREAAARVLDQLAAAGEPRELRVRFLTGRGNFKTIGWTCQRDGEEGNLYLAGRDVSDQHLRALDGGRFFELSIDLVCVAGFDGHFKRVSPAFTETLGWSEEELLAAPFSEIVHPEDREATDAELEKLATGGSTIRFENRYRTKAGEYRWIQWVCRPEPGSELLYAVGRDVTDDKDFHDELRDARDTAETASWQKSRFLANMSHELRTPLNAIIGYSEILLEDAEDDGLAEVLGDLRRIHDAGNHLLALINQILDISKIEAGRVDLFYEKIAVPEVVDSVVRTVEPLLARNGNTLSIQVAAVQPIQTDRTKLRQILLNLVENATKFTENGEVRVTVAAAADGRIQFEVSDNGIGMTAAEVKHIFEPFGQADKSTTRRFGGTGLGLTISQRFCHLLGGEFVVDSTPAEGTTFRFVLPLDAPGRRDAPGTMHVRDVTGGTVVTVESPATGSLPAVSEPRDRPPSDEEISAALPWRRVLLIEDDSDARELLTRVLTTAGYEVSAAHSGESGLDLARRIRPSVIIVDVMMTHERGWSVLTALDADPELRAVPVVMLSHDAEGRVGFAMGIGDHLTKPVGRERLLEITENYRAKGRTSVALVVDDERSVRMVVERVLSRQGWEVREAENGLSGLESLSESVPDVILLDLAMPEMDGFEFVARLRGRPEWAQVPVVVVTSKELTEHDRMRLSTGVHDLVSKGDHALKGLLAEVGRAVTRQLMNIVGRPSE